MVKINLPISEENVRKLKVGDEVLLSGTIITARDTAHKYMVEEKPEDIRPYLENNAIYHCGPVVDKKGDKYSFVAAGPTTSSREEPYEADVIRMYKVRGIIGKGGMGQKTLKACVDYGAVYFHAIGGAATLLAQCVVEVKTVFRLDFGVPEAFWVIEVKDFPVVVTMDSHGNSLHEVIKEESRPIYEQLIK